MPGLFGHIKKHHQSTSAISRIIHMQEELYPVTVEHEYQDQRLAAVRCFSFYEKMTHQDESGWLQIWVEGCAYNLAEIAHHYQQQFQDLNQALIWGYQYQMLAEILATLDGIFCAVLYDRQQKKISLISDRNGMRSLFYYHKNGFFAWASETKAFLALDFFEKKLDTQALSCFMDLGYLVGDISYFEGVSLLPPATLLTYDMDADRLHSLHYWSWSHIKQCNISFDDAVDSLGEIVTRAVGRRLDMTESLVFPISGGLDSRMLLAATYRLYPEYKGPCFTFGTHACADIVLAQQVTDMAGWAHEIHELTPDNWFERRIPTIWVTDGQLDMQHMHGCEFVDDIAKQGRFVMNGYSGDAILGPSFLRADTTNKRINKNIAEEYYGRYAYLADIESSFYDIPHVEPNLFINRVRRFTNMGTLASSPWLEHKKPFLDNELIEFVFSINDEYRLGNKLYSTMLLNQYPEFYKTIPWQKTGKTIDNNPEIAMPLCTTENYTDYANWIRKPDIAVKIDRILNSPAALYRNFIDEDWHKIYLVPHLKQNLNRSNKILRAVTIELFLQNCFQYP
ncbi:asparagine synthase-related protein [Aeromonas hydrophila]|uniref:asparagine synthase-related protein n=1 Tax=Aeromonas hydrophila TaxID=644 RepID=UPI0020A21E0F|nr:asparagine synthase-related protein [Aeromonas hydrophila]MCP1266620.1 asparagine synthase-related protein [Aeromonas hydrophila]MCP1295312.1 asparagine synthase-related protein [Aeromonas hydrophila]